MKGRLSKIFQKLLILYTDLQVWDTAEWSVKAAAASRPG